MLALTSMAPRTKIHNAGSTCSISHFMQMDVDQGFAFRDVIFVSRGTSGTEAILHEMELIKVADLRQAIVRIYVLRKPRPPRWPPGGRATSGR